MDWFSMTSSVRSASWFLHIGLSLTAHLVARVDAILSDGPIGTVIALATQARVFRSQVSVSYLEPVNITLSFDEDVDDFGHYSLTRAPTTKILNFVQLRKSKYEFQVFSEVSANVSISISPNTIRSSSTRIFNKYTTAVYSFEYHAEAPNVSLQLDGFQAHHTNKLENVVYLLFSSTTEYDGTRFFNKSLISIDIGYDITNFKKVNEKLFRFKFTILKNESTDASDVDCVNATDESDDAVQFSCSLCPRSKRCAVSSTWPPAGVNYLEFPLKVDLAPIPGLKMDALSLPILYDTLWAEVSLDVPTYARDAFPVTVTWTEPMTDLRSAFPVFGITGPGVDEELVSQNATVVGPTALRMFVTPGGTGVLPISINGTQRTRDLAGNSNDFRRNPATRTGDVRHVIFSAGPPLEGAISFDYDRPPAAYEYNALSESTLSGDSSLTLSWSGFASATRYDLWIKWGDSTSTEQIKNLTDTFFRFSQFRLFFGVEYHVHLRAWNVWGENLEVSKVYLHPPMDIVADGTYPTIRLPDLMGNERASVRLNLLVPSNGFLSTFPLRVLRFRSVDKASGDEDACKANSRLMECTFMNFHIEVPDVEFVVFRKPFRLQFVFGRDGWEDAFFRPMLYYWEASMEEWRNVTRTCPAEQVYDAWNASHGTYEVSVCHLSQFSVFAQFSKPKPTAAPSAPSQPPSDSDPVFFYALAGVVLAMILLCWIFYRACIHSGSAMRAYSELGIRPIFARIPSFRPRPPAAPASDPRGSADLAEPASEPPMLALPPAPVGASEDAGEFERLVPQARSSAPTSMRVGAGASVDRVPSDSAFSDAKAEKSDASELHPVMSAGTLL